ncbi:MAG: hypothetical protein MZV64_09965 [Ignavibacteriales bacterium]|nr:hypothetical protein [Ignavibacteriales bacterium]
MHPCRSDRLSSDQHLSTHRPSRHPVPRTAPAGLPALCRGNQCAAGRPLAHQPLPFAVHIRLDRPGESACCRPQAQGFARLASGEAAPTRSPRKRFEPWAEFLDSPLARRALDELCPSDPNAEPPRSICHEG